MTENKEFKVGDLVAKHTGNLAIRIGSIFHGVYDVASSCKIRSETILGQFYEGDVKDFRPATLEEKQAYYQSQIDKANEALEKLKEPENKYPRLEKNGEYHYVHSLNFNKVLSTSDNKFEHDEFLYLTGNYFYTKSEAEHEARHRRFEMEVASFIKQRDGRTVYLDSEKTYWSFDVFLDNCRVISSQVCVIPRMRGWYATTQETIQAAIDHFTPEKFIAWAKGEL